MIDGIDCFVLGNHTWDKPDIIKYINNKKVVRPYNYGKMPGSGYRYFKKDDYDIFVIQLMGEVYIHNKVENPFKFFNKVLTEIDEYIKKNNQYKDENMKEYKKRKYNYSIRFSC